MSSPVHGLDQDQTTWRQDLLAGVLWLHVAWFGFAALGLWDFPPAWIATGSALLAVAALVRLARREQPVAAAGMVVVTGLEIRWAMEYFGGHLRHQNVTDLFFIGYAGSMMMAIVASLLVAIGTTRGRRRRSTPAS